jgi:hypothetical protein
MTSSRQQMRPHPEVVDTELDDQETVLLHLKSKMYFSLNTTGSRIWKGLKEGLSVDQISDRLQQEFEVGPQHANQAVAALMLDLQQQDLVEPVDSNEK